MPDEVFQVSSHSEPPGPWVGAADLSAPDAMLAPLHLPLAPTVDRALGACRRNGTSLAVLSMDFDGQGPFAPWQPPSVKAQALQAVWLRLRSHLRATDLAIHVDGDEFAVVLVNVTRRTAALVECRLASLLAEPCRVDGLDIGVPVCTGLAMYPDGGVTGAELVESAVHARTNRIGTCMGPSAHGPFE